jgi:hypothetical protein
MLAWLLSSSHFALSALERLIRAITQGVALGYYIFAPLALQDPKL